MSTNFSIFKRLVFGVFTIAIALVSGPARTVPAQTEDSQGWTPAINLSVSGSSLAPVAVQDAFGTVYVVWKDEFKGVMYARLVEGAWTAPVEMDAPWGAAFIPGETEAALTIFDPVFVADSAGRIHAFWIDDTSRLLESTVEPNQFVNEAWSAPLLISDAVIGFAVDIDDGNQLHLSYVSTLDSADLPAGVYYRRSNTIGGAWSIPELLYESEYYRGIAGTDLDLRILVVENDQGKFVYATFDNRPRKQFYLALSRDGGSNWDAPLLVAGPSGSLDANIPSGVGLAHLDDRLLLLWRESEVETPSNCVQYYQVYNLDGTPAQLVQSMFNELSGCPSGEETVLESENLIIVMANLFTASYLVAWNGSTWSMPQVQSELLNFIDPGTFDVLELGCLDMWMGAPETIYLIGCDAGPSGDIWFSTRPATDITDWFSTSEEWSSPVPLISSGGVIDPVTLVSDRTGILHAIWAQTDSQFNENKRIYYARWDGSTWSYLLPIINPAFAKVNMLSAVIDPEADRLYLVWSGGERGELYFSWAKASLAGSGQEWSPAVVLPMPRPIGGGADIFVDEGGSIFIAYSVPLNEQRGVYFVRSDDFGVTWSGVPTRILDGVGLGWEVVGAPSLTRTPDGTLHVLVSRNSPPEGVLLNRLYYTSSIDAGLTWSTPIEIVAGGIGQSAIGQTPGRGIYRYWQESFNDVVTNHIQSSADNGLNWSETMNFIGLDALDQTSALLEDAAGDLHLIQTAEVTENALQLQEWLWNGTSWSTEKSLEIGAGILDGNSGMAAAVRGDVYLGVLISKSSNDPAAPGSQLIFVERRMDIEIPEPPAETPTTIPEPTATPAPTATPEPLPTSSTPPPEVLPQIEDGPGSGNLVLQLIVSFSAAILVVMILSFLINRRIRREI